ncbi:MAG: EAL domain-containing protein [Spirochaetales bacterium]
MSCENCTTTPALPSGQKNFIFYAAHPYMLTKCYQLFQDDASAQLNDGFLTLQYDFQKLLGNFISSKAFTEKELNSILLIPIDLNEPISFSIFRRAKSLSYFINLTFAKDLKWILDNQRLITLFQPIVNWATKEIVAYECLNRGVREDGSLMPPQVMFESARKTEMLFNLDRQCRQQSLREAKHKNIDKGLFINFSPSSIYNPEFCLADTVEWAQKLQYDFSKVVFEVVESDRIDDPQHLKTIIEYYLKMGFKVALDDVGSGYATLNLLAELRPHIIKINMELIRNVHKDSAKRTIVKSLVLIAREIQAKTLAEGVETKEELEVIQDLGIDLVQGYLFGKPAVEPATHIYI